MSERASKPDARDVCERLTDAWIDPIKVSGSVIFDVVDVREIVALCRALREENERLKNAVHFPGGHLRPSDGKACSYEHNGAICNKCGYGVPPDGVWDENARLRYENAETKAALTLTREALSEETSQHAEALRETEEWQLAAVIRERENAATIEALKAEITELRGDMFAQGIADERAGVTRIEGWAAICTGTLWEFAEDSDTFVPGTDSRRATLLLHGPTESDT